MATKSKPEFSVISGGIAGLDDVIQEKSQERLILVDGAFCARVALLSSMCACGRLSLTSRGL